MTTSGRDCQELLYDRITYNRGAGGGPGGPIPDGGRSVVTRSRSVARVAVAVAVLAGMILAPTMATFAGDVLAPAEPDAGEALVLEPHPGPNGEYAFVNDDDELEIATEDVNPGTQSSFEDVFTITNNASRAVEVNVSHDAEDAVVFDSNGSSAFGAIQTDEGITIPANGTVAVGFHVDSGGAAAGETLLETITFHATWADEDGETGSTPSSESFSVDSSSPTETPTPTPSSTTDGPDAPTGSTETPTPTETPDSSEESPSPTETDDSIVEVAGLDSAWLWVVIALGIGTVAAGYAYRRVG